MSGLPLYGTSSRIHESMLLDPHKYAKLLEATNFGVSHRKRLTATFRLITTLETFQDALKTVPNFPKIAMRFVTIFVFFQKLLILEHTKMVGERLPPSPPSGGPYFAL